MLIIIVFSIIIYITIILNIFNILLSSFTNSLPNFKIKYLSSIFMQENINYNFKNIFLFSIISLSGIPPLLNFFIKTHAIILISLNNNLYLLLLFILLNIFSIYFYTINYKYSYNTSNNTTISKNIFHYKINYKICIITSFLNFFNFFSFFFLLDMYVYFCSFIFI